MVFSVTTTRAMSLRTGSSNMVSSSASSMIARRPRAPLLRAMAFFAMALSASSSKSSSTPSSSMSFLYCFTSALRGSVRMRTSASSSRLSSVTRIGRRPTNSGIRPNLSRSSGRMSARISPTFFFVSRLLTSAPKPMEPAPLRFSMILSMPSNAPPQMNRIFVVSIWMNS